ncbi:sulfotransferase family protein [Halalkalibacter lacteus]|uniref:sulfotransferase family protein n=1 Tax=Halalkalibacter lacteus TaxID=3090663 RepID=UPI002FC9DAB4
MGNQKVIFVIGTGRSGTHWVGHILQSHPNIHVSIEKPEIFNRVTNMALNNTTKKELFPQLVELYRKEQKIAYPKHYADKSHPNIWLAEELAATFPNAKFIGIYRNPYATVASMLKHQGVQMWYKKWSDYPIPNRFLGITNENVNDFKQMSLPVKCALRWQSHKLQLNYLETTLKERLHIISYEKLIRQHKAEAKKLQTFLKLIKPFPSIQIKKESLNRWKSELSKSMCKEIESVLEFGPDNQIK